MITFSIIYIFIVFNCQFVNCAGDLTGHIVGGVYATIEKYPHSAHLVIQCLPPRHFIFIAKQKLRYDSDSDTDYDSDSDSDSDSDIDSYSDSYSDNDSESRSDANSDSDIGNGKMENVPKFSCGSSILNQHFLLSAAHCFEECMPVPRTFILVTVGAEDKRKGIKKRAEHFVRHEDYNPDTMENDISLIRLHSPLKFGQNIQRAALVEKFPYHLPGELAGWGYVNEELETGTNIMKSTVQKIFSHEQCLELLSSLPPATICAGFENPTGDEGYAAQGDSGSGLMVKKFAIVGVVSYKLPNLTPSIVVFTETGLFYNWITRTTSRLYCHSNKPTKDSGGSKKEKPPKIKKGGKKKKKNLKNKGGKKKNGHLKNRALNRKIKHPKIRSGNKKSKTSSPSGIRT